MFFDLFMGVSIFFYFFYFLDFYLLDLYILIIK